MKIVVSDFDSTFFTLQYLDNIEIVRDFVQKGNVFVIATGRNYVQLQSEIENFVVPYSFLICNDGSTIYDSEGNTLFEKKIEQSVGAEIFRILDKERSISETFMDNNSIYSVNTEESATKIIAKPKNFEKAEDILANILLKYPMVDGYISENWINITSCEVNKATAIAFLLEMYGLNHEDVYTIGDNINDIAMMDAYNSFVVAEAEEHVKLHAKQTVETFKEAMEFIKKES